MVLADDATHHPRPLLPLRRGVTSMAVRDLCGCLTEELQRSFASLRMTASLPQLHFTTGASATLTSPMMKKANISASKRLVARSAPLNSFQTNTPQIAPTMVEPWPSA